MQSSFAYHAYSNDTTHVEGGYTRRKQKTEKRGKKGDYINESFPFSHLTNMRSVVTHLLVALVVLSLVVSSTAREAAPRKAVQLFVGESSNISQNRLVFRTPPQTPFIVTAFNDNTLSISHLNTPIMVFGVSQRLKSDLTGFKFREVPKAVAIPQPGLFYKNDESLKQRRLKQRMLGRKAGSQETDDDGFIFSFLQKDEEEDDKKGGKKRGGKRGKKSVAEVDSDKQKDDAELKKQATAEAKDQLDNEADDNKTGDEEPEKKEDDNTATPIKKGAKGKRRGRGKGKGKGRGGRGRREKKTVEDEEADNIELEKAAANLPSVKDQIIDVAKKQSEEYATFMHMKNLYIKGTLDVRNPGPVVGAISQWAMVAFDDMETDSIRQSWSNSDHNVCGGGKQGAVVPDIHLGGHCKFSDVEVSKEFQDLPPHKYIRISARYHFLDKWLGEWGYMKVDDRVVWTETHHHCPKIWEDLCGGISVCGDANFNDRLSAHISITIPHTDKSFKVAFGSSLKGDACDASYGVDDVMISCL